VRLVALELLLGHRSTRTFLFFSSLSSVFTSV